MSDENSGFVYSALHQTCTREMRDRIAEDGESIMGVQ